MLASCTSADQETGDESLRGKAEGFGNVFRSLGGDGMMLVLLLSICWEQRIDKFLLVVLLFLLYY